MKRKILIALIVLTILATGYGIGFFKGRYNLVVVTEADWHEITELRANQADAEYKLYLENNLKLAE